MGPGKTLCDITKDKTTGKNIYTKLYDLLLAHILGFLLDFSKYFPPLFGQQFAWLSFG